MKNLTQDEAIIKLIQLDELLARLDATEHPADVKILGQKFPAVPMADPRFFVARRRSVWEDKAKILLDSGRTLEAAEAMRQVARLHVIWKGLTER